MASILLRGRHLVLTRIAARLDEIAAMMREKR